MYFTYPRDMIAWCTQIFIYKPGVVSRCRGQVAFGGKSRVLETRDLWTGFYLRPNTKIRRVL